MLETEEIKLKIEAMDKEKRFKRDSLVIYICLGLGCLCVGRAFFKTWLADAVQFDWFVLGMGVALCGMSLLKKVEVGKAGITAELRELTKAMERKIQ